MGVTRGEGGGEGEGVMCVSACVKVAWRGLMIDGGGGKWCVRVEYDV